MCVSLRSGDEIKGIMGRVIDSATRQERGEVLPLDPLEKESVEQLIEGMTGDSSLKATLGEWIFKSIGGNPFFLEEMLKHLVEQKLLCREFGRWRFAESDLKKLEVPESVGAVLLRRFEQLSPPARALANWLALFQGDVSEIAPELGDGTKSCSYNRCLAGAEPSPDDTYRNEKNRGDSRIRPFPYCRGDPEQPAQKAAPENAPQNSRSA